MIQNDMAGVVIIVIVIEKSYFSDVSENMAAIFIVAVQYFELFVSVSNESLSDISFT